MGKCDKLRKNIEAAIDKNTILDSVTKELSGYLNAQQNQPAIFMVRDLILQHKLLKSVIKTNGLKNDYASQTEEER